MLTSISMMIHAQDKTSEASSLAGFWNIDLRPTPDAEEYIIQFVVSDIEDSSFRGTFYGSKFKDGLINDSWEVLYFSFTTKDKNNTYYHSGWLEDGKLQGISYCPDREFTAPWKGSKSQE